MQKIYQMENSNPTSASNTTSKRNFRNNSSNRNSRSISMSSDTESQDFFYSPYPFDSPLQASDDPVFRTEPTHSSMTIVPAVSKKKKVTSQNFSYLDTPPALPPPPPPPPAHLMMLSWNEGVPNSGVEEEVGGADQRRSKATFQQSERVVKVKVKQAALGLRICEVILCLLSFFVMVSDKTRGWSGDSYYRYREYRYLVGVNIIGCIHSGVQACDMAYCLVTGKHVISYHLRYYLDFIIDQIVAYLLISASSAAATRMLDWVSNWGKDAFTQMANASIWLSFMAFFAFAFSSLICGYFISCCHDSAG